MPTWNGPEPDQMNSITHWLEHGSVAQPEKRLYTFLDLDGRERESYTYRTFLERTTNLATYLYEKAGLRNGDRVLLVYPARPGDDRDLLRMRPHRRDRRSCLRAISDGPRGRAGEAQVHRPRLRGHGGADDQRSSPRPPVGRAAIVPDLQRRAYAPAILHQVAAESHLRRSSRGVCQL